MDFVPLSLRLDPVVWLFDDKLPALHNVNARGTGSQLDLAHGQTLQQRIWRSDLQRPLLSMAVRLYHHLPILYDRLFGSPLSPTTPLVEKQSVRHIKTMVVVEMVVSWRHLGPSPDSVCRVFVWLGYTKFNSVKFKRVYGDHRFRTRSLCHSRHQVGR